MKHGDDAVNLYLCVSIQSPTSDYSNPDAVTISGVTMKGPGIRDDFTRRLCEVLEQTLQEHGGAAFQMPKTAAAIHESGHIVVGHSLGYHIKNARLIEHLPGIWGGITYPEHEPVGRSVAGRETALRHARMIYAGLAAEAFLPPELQHVASSIDELMMSQWITNTFVAGDEDPATCWDREVHDDVISRLKRNHETLLQIGKRLFEKSRIGGPRLRRMLSAVQID